MTVIEAALSAVWPTTPESVTLGHYQPINGERVNDPPPIEMAVKKYSREMSWPDALPALEALGNEPAAPITVRTKELSVLIEHRGTGWRIV